MLNQRTRKFFSYYKPYLGLFIGVLICAFLTADVSLVLPMLIRYITKTVLAGDLSTALPQIYRVGGVMLALVFFQIGVGFFVDYRGHAMGAAMERDLRAELFSHFQKLPIRYYDENRVGQLMSRITNDLLMLAELYHHGPEDYLIYLVKFTGAFVILLTINVPLTLAVFAFLPIMGVFSLYFNQKMLAVFKTSKECIAGVNAQVEDSLSGIWVVKSFANEETENTKFFQENDRFLESRKAIYKNEAYFYQGMNLLIQLITVTVIVFGGTRIVHANLDLADLITFLLYIGNLIEPVQKLAHMTEQFQEGIAGFERFMEIMELEPEPRDESHTLDLAEVQGCVEFIDVGFRYQESRPAVLKHIDLKVNAGEYIALVGSSGVGKTTLCSLIPRFYDLTEGRILLDGVDIQNVRLSSLRRNVGIVQQDVYLFAGSVLDNIRYGKPEAGLDEIVAAAKKANAHDFIVNLPEGYHTDIGQRGVKLSGGQKQRLSIARVFLKDPPVLIFDEATSALDSESEKVVLDSLEELAKNRTTFVIAHRLSTIRNAHRIVVLTERGIEEQGTHAELMALGGVYARVNRE